MEDSSSKGKDEFSSRAAKSKTQNLTAEVAGGAEHAGKAKTEIRFLRPEENIPAFAFPACSAPPATSAVRFWVLIGDYLWCLRVKKKPARIPG